MAFYQAKIQKNEIKNLGQGFTFIELLVVLAILGIMASLIIANYNGQRASRNVRIARNEMVTNLRKMQSYALSSRTLGNGQSVQYYVMKLDTATGQSGKYSLQAVLNVGGSPQLNASVETYPMAAGVTIQSVKISRNVSPTVSTPSCALLAYKLPFAEFTSTDGCTFNNFANGLPTDYYTNILDFRTNVDNNPTAQDSKVVITVADASASVSEKILINGVSGNICPTVDETTCANN